MSENNLNEEKTSGLIKKSENHLMKIREEILGKGQEKRLTHKLDFNLLPVSQIHTYDSESIIFADYEFGSVVRGFNVKTEEIIFETEWDETTELEFAGYGNCPSFLITTDYNSNNLRAFNLGTGESYRVNTFHSGRVNDIIYSRYCYSLLTISNDGTVNVFSQSDFNLIRRIPDRGYGAATSIALLPNGPNIIVGYDLGMMIIYNAQTGEKVREILLGLLNPVISISATDRHVIAANDYKIEVFSLYSNEVKRIVVPERISVIRTGMGDIWNNTYSRFSYGLKKDNFLGNAIFVGTDIGIIYVYDIDTGKQIHKIEGHNIRITGLIISPDRHVFSGSLDGAIRRYDLTNNICKNIYYKNDGCRSLAFSKEEKRLCVSGLIDNKAKIINMETGIAESIISHQNSVRCVRFFELRGWKLLVTGSWDRTVKITDYKNNRLIKEINVPGRVCDCRISANYLLIGFYEKEGNGGFQVYNLLNFNKIFSTEDHSIRRFDGRSIVVTVFEDFIFSGGDDGVLNKWSLKDGNVVSSKKCRGSIRSILFSKRGKLFLGFDYPEVEVVDPVLNQHLSTIQLKNAYGTYSIIESEKFIFMGHDRGMISKFDASTLELVATFKYHTERVWDLEIIPELGIIISAAEDGRVNFISFETGELLGSHYNVKDGFLFTSTQDNNEYFWTDLSERILVINNNDNDDAGNVNKEELENYFRIHNNCKMVMSKLLNDRYSQLLKTAYDNIKMNKELEKSISLTNIKLLDNKNNNAI